MGNLYLVRHGQASFGADDYDQLSDLGIRQTVRLGHNVIRLLMAQAASNANVDPRNLSFKHTVQLRNARTGELTPPGITRLDFSNSASLVSNMASAID